MRAYGIGDIVLVLAEARAHYGDPVPGTRSRTIVRHQLPVPRAGWITGWRCLRSGRVIWETQEYAGRLIVQATHPVYLVAYWPTMRPVWVYGSDLMPAGAAVPVSPQSLAAKVHATARQQATLAPARCVSTVLPGGQGG